MTLDDSFPRKVTISALLILKNGSTFEKVGLLWLHGFYI